MSSVISSLLSFTSPQVKSLLRWKHPDEEEKWAEKAVDTLVKKLKKKPNALKDLEDALTQRNGPGKCVTIERSLDGRLQVAHRKSLPHVIYCKVWIWPDLQSHHELRALPICNFPFNAKQKREVCINPYHYERVSLDAGGMVSPMLMQQQANPSMIPPHQAQAPPPPQSHYGQEHSMGQGSSYNTMEGYNYSSPLMNPGASAMSPYPPDLSSPSLGIPSPPSCGMPYSPPQQQPAQINSPCGPDTPPPAYSPMDEAKYASQLHMQNDNAMDTSSAFVMNQATPAQATHHLGNSEPTTHWANIAYYELNSRVGEMYKAGAAFSVINVDGFTNPGLTNSRNHTANRFCLGQLSNVNRNSTIENTRRHIGQGIELRKCNNQVVVKCLSKQAIFVQSRNFNYTNNQPPTTVCKVPAEHEMVIFNKSEFARLLTESANKDYESVFELLKMCTIRMSFVKGWGIEYHRQDVTSTPCWIEIHLLEPLQWLDKVLTQLGSPDNNITSVS